MNIEYEQMNIRNKSTYYLRIILSSFGLYFYSPDLIPSSPETLILFSE